MRDWETRTFTRPPLDEAAKDAFNSIQLPASQLMASLAAAERERKSRFFNSVEVRAFDATLRPLSVAVLQQRCVARPVMRPQRPGPSMVPSMVLSGMR